MAININSAKEMNNIVMEGMALVVQCLKDIVIPYIEEKYPDKRWEQTYEDKLSARGKNGDLKYKAILKEWKSNHIVNIKNLYAFIVESKWRMGFSEEYVHEYEETKHSIIDLVEGITRRTMDHHTVYYSPTQMFNDMINIANNLGNAKLVNRLNRLYEELNSLEEV